jgi:mRNA-degrading endonuclease RelE of RelBE toxin-antitoxin system
VAAALQIWSPTFAKAFDALPESVRADVQRKVDDLGTRLEIFSHQRLTGRSEFKLRVGDYRSCMNLIYRREKFSCTTSATAREIYQRN